MRSFFWELFAVATALKTLCIPTYHSTDFEVHRNWMAITYSLPLRRWYYERTSVWTLDYPPFFAYFEWALAQVAQFIDPAMLRLRNHNYASDLTKNFLRLSVIFMDIVFAFGVLRCFRALRIPKHMHAHFTGEVLLFLNVGLLFVDHIHFQYNGFLFGVLLLSISFLLEERYLLCGFTFAVLLNFKHIFLYMAPAFAVYLFRFYCLEAGEYAVECFLKLTAVGSIPFLVSFGPFWKQLPQVFARLFPFKRGLTHAYWAPNFWAIYNAADKVAAKALHIPNKTNATTTSGLVQEFEHVVLPTITPKITFFLSLLFMLPILIKLFSYTKKSESKMTFLRATILCSCAAFMFGWHVHEKAILMCLIPLCFLCLINQTDAKYAYFLSVVGYFSLFPLLFHIDLLLVRYSLYLAYIVFMYAQIIRIYNAPPAYHWLEAAYMFGFIALPLYEHIISPLMGWHKKLAFMPLLLTSLYCALGVVYFFIRYYIYSLLGTLPASAKVQTKSKVKLRVKAKAKSKSAATIAKSHGAEALPKLKQKKIK